MVARFFCERTENRMLDKRLQCVGAMVREGASLADIGTDHAYLPVALMQEGRIVGAIAADIGEGPAASARQHITEAGLSEQIAVRVCDGLRGIAPDEVTDIVIAGMGGETIIHILEDAPWTRTETLRLILQPMTKSAELRLWLDAHGFAIEEEHVVCDGRHVYLALAASFADAPACNDPLFPFVGALTASEETRPYLEQQCGYLTQKLGGLRCGGKTQEADALEEVLQRLLTFMNGGESSDDS